MEFKSLKNIETSFRQIRLFGIIYTAACALVVVCSVVCAFRFAEAQRQKIYVLDGGKSLMLALSQDLSQNRPAEAREHVRRFHELFFTLSPEKSAIEHNVKRALLLADRSAYNYYADFAEKGFYNRIIAGNINQVLQVDSVVCNFDRYPYEARTYARQMIIRESNVTERTLVTVCRLLNASRSDDNPNGFTSRGSRYWRTGTSEAWRDRRMGKTRIIIEKCATRFRTELHGKLDTLPPKARLAVIAGMLVPFAAGCLYTTATAIAGFGKSEKALEIRHIGNLNLPVQENDNLYNNVYGNEKRTEE